VEAEVPLPLGGWEAVVESSCAFCKFLTSASNLSSPPETIRSPPNPKLAELKPDPEAFVFLFPFAFSLVFELELDAD
jgi:hypothetical protein